MKMKYKLIATDYDYTLANTPNLPTKKTIEVINRYRAKGGLFTVVTGRMTCGILNKLEGIETDLPISSYQGAVVYDRKKGKVVKDWNMSTVKALMLLDELSAKGYEYNTYINDELWLPREYKRTGAYCEANGINFHVSPNLRDYISSNGFSIPKMLIVLPEKEAKKREKYYSDKYKDIFTVTRSSPIYLEFTDISASKGNALRWIAENNGINADEIMAFGDSTNDISMIEHAGLGVAMGNAMDEVKAKADIIADNCENDGVAKIIEKYCL
jgi:hypothetical protein